MIFRRNSSISISTRRKWLRQNARQNGWFFVAKRTSNSISFKCLPFIAIKTLEHAKIDYLELYLYDRALKSEAVKPPSTYREPLKNRCGNISKIIEKRRLATSYYSDSRQNSTKVDTPKVSAAKSTPKSWIITADSRQNSSSKSRHAEGKCVKSHAKIDDFSSTLTKSTPQSMIFRRNSSISIWIDALIVPENEDRAP